MLQILRKPTSWNVTSSQKMTNSMCPKSKISILLFTALCMLPGSVFAERGISLSLGLAYTLESSKSGLAAQRDRSLSMPLSVSAKVSSAVRVRLSVPMISSSSERTTANDIVSTSESGIGDVMFGFNYGKSPGPLSSWPSFSIDFSHQIPTGDSANVNNAGSSGTGGGISKTSVSIGLVKPVDPASLFLTLGFSYGSAYSRDTVVIQPGSTVIYGFGASFGINNNVTFTSRINGSVEKDLQANNSRIPGTGSESMSLGADISYRLGQNQSVSSGFSFGLVGDGSASVDLSYTRYY